MQYVNSKGGWYYYRRTAVPIGPTWSQGDCHRLADDEVEFPAGLQRLKLLLDASGRFRTSRVRIELEHRTGDMDRVLAIAQWLN